MLTFKLICDTKNTIKHSYMLATLAYAFSYPNCLQYKIKKIIANAKINFSGTIITLKIINNTK